GGRGRAKVNAQRQDELNQQSTSFAQLQNGSPQDVGEHETHKIEVLGEFEGEISQHFVGGLADYGVREPAGSTQKRDGTKTEEPLELNFRKDVHIQADECEEENDGQYGVGVEIEIPVGERLYAFLLQNLPAAQARGRAQYHVQIQKEVATEELAADRAHHHK